ncbi:hypothetical protein KY366_04845 [Candidatus Woesearchaeota archaeon]|nr:hypothetical protein [Candidatus Woesearchaeota archaeon]
MVAGMGLWGKNIHDTLIKAIKMRFDAKHVTKDMSKQKRLEKELDHYEKNHRIEKIEEVEKKLDQIAEDAAVHSHRLIVLDLLILYGVIKNCEIFVNNILMKQENELNREEKRIRGAMLKVIKKYGLKEKDVKEKLRNVISDIKKNLQRERKIEYSMDMIAKGETGVALQLKEATSIKVRLIRYMKMRFETKGARKGLKKGEEILRQLTPFLVHLDLIINKKETDIKKIEKELKKIDEKEKDFVKSFAKAAENVHLLFVNDFLVMRLIIMHLHDEEISVQELAQKHEIPRVLEITEKTKKDEILSNIEKRLADERQDIMQIWGEIKKVNV